MREVPRFVLGSFIIRQLKEGRAVFITPEGLEGFEFNSDPAVMSLDHDTKKVCPVITFVKEHKALNSDNTVIGDIKVSEVLVEPKPEEPSFQEALKKSLMEGSRLISEIFGKFINPFQARNFFEDPSFKDLSLTDQLKRASANKSSDLFHKTFYDLPSRANLTMGKTRPSPFGKKKFARPKKVIRK